MARTRVLTYKLRVVGGTLLTLLGVLGAMGLWITPADPSLFVEVIAWTGAALVPFALGVTLLARPGLSISRQASRVPMDKLMTLAAQEGGQLGAMHVAAAFELPPEEAVNILDELTAHGLITQQISEMGQMTYVFPQSRALS